VALLYERCAAVLGWEGWLAAWPADMAGAWQDVMTHKLQFVLLD
jgi:hypothetical protein